MKSDAMHVRELVQSVFRIERSVDLAARFGDEQVDAPQSLKACLRLWEQRADGLREQMQQTLSEQTLSDGIDELDAIGRQTLDACRQAGAGAVEPQVLVAIQRAQQTITELKHQLH